MEAVKPSLAAWEDLIAKSSKVSVPAPIGLVTEDAIFWNIDERLKELVGAKNFDQLGIPELLLVIHNDFWNELPSDQAIELGMAFWAYFAKDNQAGPTLYYWFFKSPLSFHDALQKCMRDCKDHPEPFGELLREDFRRFARNLLKEKEPIDALCARRSIPLNAFLGKKRFQKALSEAYWALKPLDSTFGRKIKNFISIMAMADTDQRKGIMHSLAVVRDPITPETVLPQHPEIVALLIRYVDRSALGFKSQQLFTRAVNQIDFFELGHHLKSLDISTFLTRNFSDKRVITNGNSELQIKQLITSRFSTASRYQKFFEYGYVVLADYYDGILSLRSGLDCVKRPPLQSDHNYILLIKSNGQFACIALPNNKTKTDNNERAWFGQLHSNATKEDLISRFPNLGECTSEFHPISRNVINDKWHKIFEEKLHESGLIDKDRIRGI